MLFITQAASIVLGIYILVQNLDSISPQFNELIPISNTTRLLNSFNYIHIKQQLHSKLPNFNEKLRDLKPKELNFLHTTDTHGWYLGHLNQRQFSSDWGDFISFVSNFKELCNSSGGDLILVDTGDKHDGNGLSDLSIPNGVLSSKIFMNAPYDLITVGNHELYAEAVSAYEYENVVPRYGEAFISTNVEYLNDDGDWVIFGNSKYRYFETNINKYKIFSLSFLFDFKGGNNRVRVDPIEKVIKEDWFHDLMTDYSTNYDVDIVVIFGHLPVSHDWVELYSLHSIVRKYFPSTVIQYFGGHSHIRDFSILDELSTGLQSGRYCETVGFLSLSNFTNLQTGIDSLFDPQQDSESRLDRKYIDFNLHSFLHHSNLSSLSEFNTLEGLKVSDELYSISQELKLNEAYGFVPKNYYMATADYHNRDPKSLLRFLEDDILTQLEPKLCHIESSVESSDFKNSRIVIINSGSIRYDLYKGAFNRNSQFTVSPFKNKWKVIPDVPFQFAMKLKPLLNSAKYILSEDDQENDLDLSDLLSPYQKAIMNQNNLSFSELELNDETFNSRNIRGRLSEISELMNNILMGPFNSEDSVLYKDTLSYGYKTTDDLGSNGDDTIHRPLPYFPVPNVIQSYEKSEYEDSNELVDVVFYDFIQTYILWALKIACEDDLTFYQEAVSRLGFYNDCEQEYNIGELLKKYVVKNWS